MTKHRLRICNANPRPIYEILPQDFTGHMCKMNSSYKPLKFSGRLISIFSFYLEPRLKNERVFFCSPFTGEISIKFLLNFLLLKSTEKFGSCPCFPHLLAHIHHPLLFSKQLTSRDHIIQAFCTLASSWIQGMYSPEMVQKVGEKDSFSWFFLA